jgi:hypothetical protein
MPIDDYPPPLHTGSCANCIKVVHYACAGLAVHERNMGNRLVTPKRAQNLSRIDPTSIGRVHRDDGQSGSCCQARHPLRIDSGHGDQHLRASCDKGSKGGLDCKMSAALQRQGPN